MARLPFGLLGGEIADGRMDAGAIVVAFDAGEQIAPGLVLGCPAAVVDEFRMLLDETEPHLGSLRERCRSL